MKKISIFLFVLALSFRSFCEAAVIKISFWTSTFYTDGTYSNFLAISGHTTEGDGPTADNNVSIMPAGSFTVMTLVTFDPGSPGWTRTATVVKNGLATAATCTVPNGSDHCTWTGNVPFNDGDLANIQITGGGGILIKAPWSIQTVFTLGKRDWPFTS